MLTNTNCNFPDSGEKVPYAFSSKATGEPFSVLCLARSLLHQHCPAHREARALRYEVTDSKYELPSQLLSCSFFLIAFSLYNRNSPFTHTILADQ